MKLYFNKIIVFIISILDKLISKNSNYVVYNSYPDLSDNSFALFLHIVENYPKKNNIWLLKNLDFKSAESVISEYSNKKNYKLVKRGSLQGIWYYLNSRYVFFTHGLFAGAKIAKKHCVVNLWHGMPLKKIGLLEKSRVPQKSKYAIASSQFYREIMSKALGLPINNVLVVGQPRIDMMLKKTNGVLKLKLVPNANQKLILWTPTYRKSIIGDIRSDGDFNEYLPLIKAGRLEELDFFLSLLNAYLIIKLHPMDILNNSTFKEYANIKILKNKDAELRSIQLYSLLAEVDVLLTDFSSIYIDFLYLNRPIGFVFQDMNAYSNSRGFVFSKPKDYMPGAMITTFHELKEFLETVLLHKKDHFHGQRKNVHNKINSNFTNHSCQLLNAIDFE
jgi:CDP-glycerol glycerophosphotransferase (TagB/SpsB family)